MTIGRLLGITLLAMALLSGVKIVFFGVFNMDSTVIMILFWLALILVTVATVRRIGVLNYLEAFLVMGLWLIMSLLADLFTTAQILGYSVYRQWEFWLGYLVILLAIASFHKKFHLHRREGSGNYFKKYFS